MINIRKGLFETNSSSSHSIVISEDTDGILDTITPDENGAITLIGGEFGWEWLRYNDALTKANYCAVDCNNDQDRLNRLAEVIKEHTGAREVIFELGKSYIDHESVGTTRDACIDKETLKNFIFNSKSWLFTGNDNTDEEPNFFDVDENIVYNFMLKLDDVDIVEKFQKVPSNDDLKEAIFHLINKHPKYRYNERSCHSFQDVGFDFCPYEKTSIDNRKINSFEKLIQGIVILYKIKNIYNNRATYIGSEILETKEINFRILPCSDKTDVRPIVMEPCPICKGERSFDDENICKICGNYGEIKVKKEK